MSGEPGTKFNPIVGTVGLHLSTYIRAALLRARGVGEIGETFDYKDEIDSILDLVKGHVQPIQQSLDELRADVEDAAAEARFYDI